MAHTSGPWSLRSAAGVEVPTSGYEIQANQRTIAYVWGPNDESNARLIIAAPALLEAAQGLLAASETNNPIEWIGVWGEFVTAILEATGEAST